VLLVLPFAVEVTLLTSSSLFAIGDAEGVSYRFPLSLAVVSSAAVTASTVESWESVFSASVVGRIAYVAMSVVCFVGVEVVEPLVAMLGHWSVIAVTGIVAVIDVAVETVGTVEPGTGADEESPGEPIRAVVAVRRAIIRCVIKISIGTDRRDSDID
jgi:hypothetical protein